MNSSPEGTPVLAQLTPYHGIEPAHQKYVSMARFHGTQRLNLMRPTRLPANSRRYTPGDPVNLIDWRAYARNEQLVLREQNDEASGRVLIFLEQAESMDWPEKAEACPKQELAWRLALNLCYQFHRWGDQVKLILVRGTNTYVIRLRSQVDTAIFFERLALQKFEPSDSDLQPPRSTQVMRTEACDLAFWISDGFRGVPAWLPERALACWLQTLSSRELDTNWLAPEQCYVDPQQLSQDFMGSSLLQNETLHHAVQQWLEKVAREWSATHPRHLVFSELTPIYHYVFALEQAWLRGKRGRG